MSDGVSQFVLLCEDEAQERLVREYLKRGGFKKLERLVRPFVASRMQHGGNDTWVLNEFPRQLHACRKRQAKSLLIIVLDADNHSVEQRRHELSERAKTAGIAPVSANDPAAFLIPKRHIETWLRALLGEKVTEEEDCKPWKKPDRDIFRNAANTLFSWTRENATAGPTCVPSLQTALPEWRRIG